MEDLRTIVSGAAGMTIKDRIRLCVALGVVYSAPPHLSLREYVALARLASTTSRLEPYGRMTPEEEWRDIALHLLSRVKELEQATRGNGTASSLDNRYTSFKSQSEEGNEVEGGASG